ncbi:hypothetical protein AB0L22_09315 [Micromonospora haikouensis]|uniref:hypothetical protein n=1 Tax=Micromonospora haikouensis TaxID=686309 RepID=UPI003413FD86
MDNILSRIVDRQSRNTQADDLEARADRIGRNTDGMTSDERNAAHEQAAELRQQAQTLRGNR